MRGLGFDDQPADVVHPVSVPPPWLMAESRRFGALGVGDDPKDVTGAIYCRGCGAFVSDK